MRNRLVMILLGVLAAASSAAAQERPFTFSVAIAKETRPSARFDYDVGIGERTFQSDTSNQPEQRLGIHASYGRVTFLGRVGMSDVGSSYQSSQSGEVFFSVLGPRRTVALAAGGGVLHEASGVNVMLARVIAGHQTRAWQVQGNVLVQKPLSTVARDELDLITSVGWARRLTPSVSLGVEAIGEDLEGFWDAAEAEGGARFLAGPSLHLAPPGERWQLIATGGPMFHPSDSQLSSGALRDLPPDNRRSSYAFKASLSVSLAR